MNDTLIEGINLAYFYDSLYQGGITQCQNQGDTTQRFITRCIRQGNTGYMLHC